MPRRLVARDDTPTSILGIVLVPIGLLLLAIAAVAVLAVFDPGLRETIAKSSTCNDQPCTAEDLKTAAPIVALSTGLIGLLLIGLGLAPLFRRRRSGDDEEGSLSGLGTVSESTGPLWPSPASLPRQDVVGRLERLADLHRSGAISEAEFEAQKARLLAEP